MQRGKRLACSADPIPFSIPVQRKCLFLPAQELHMHRTNAPLEITRDLIVHPKRHLVFHTKNQAIRDNLLMVLSQIQVLQSWSAPGGPHDVPFHKRSSPAAIQTNNTRNIRHLRLHDTTTLCIKNLSEGFKVRFDPKTARKTREK